MQYLAADDTVIMSRPLKVTGNNVMYDSKDNHLKFAHFVWPAVGEEAKWRPGFQF